MNRIEPRTRLRQTLLTAGVFTLLAMIYVPKAHYGYRLIFSQEDTSIAIFQLILNVGFAALLGAVLATIVPKMPRWVRRGLAAVVIILSLLTVSGFAWTNAAVSRAQSDERFAWECVSHAKMYQDKRVSDSDWVQLHSPERIADLSSAGENLRVASTYFRNAAKNYRLIFSLAAAAGAEEKAKRADEKEKSIRHLLEDSR